MVARLVARADVAAAVDTLLRAFAEDPLTSWLYPDGGDAARSWFDIGVRAGVRRGHTYRSGDGGAVAVWSPPSVNNFDRTEGGALQAAMAERYGDAGLARLAAAAAATGAAHPHEPHFYLFLLGAAERGRGAGAEAIAPVLRACDEQGWPAYLESSSPLNVSFYERHGFTPVQPIEIEGGPTLLGMWRPPQGG